MGLLSTMEGRRLGLPSLSVPELLALLVIVLVVFGAGEAPEIARGLGGVVADLRRASRGLDGKTI
jgi:Sec-independent protein translocase protein TatA